MSVIDEIGNQIPNVEIDTVILEPNRVVVYLHIDEYVYRNGIGTWITRRLHEAPKHSYRTKSNSQRRIFNRGDWPTTSEPISIEPGLYHRSCPT